jgi:hypothetical protein
MATDTLSVHTRATSSLSLPHLLSLHLHFYLTALTTPPVCLHRPPFLSSLNFQGSFKKKMKEARDIRWLVKEAREIKGGL